MKAALLLEPASVSPEVAEPNDDPFVVLLITRCCDEVYQTLVGFVKSMAVKAPSPPVTWVHVAVPVFLLVHEAPLLTVRKTPPSFPDQTALPTKAIACWSTWMGEFVTSVQLVPPSPDR